MKLHNYNEIKGLLFNNVNKEFINKAEEIIFNQDTNIHMDLSEFDKKEQFILKYFLHKELAYQVINQNIDKGFSCHFEGRLTKLEDAKFIALLMLGIKSNYLYENEYSFRGRLAIKRAIEELLNIKLTNKIKDNINIIDKAVEQQPQDFHIYDDVVSNRKPYYNTNDNDEYAVLNSLNKFYNDKLFNDSKCKEELLKTMAEKSSLTYFFLKSAEEGFLSVEEKDFIMKDTNIYYYLGEFYTILDANNIMIEEDIKPLKLFFEISILKEKLQEKQDELDLFNFVV